MRKNSVSMKTGTLWVMIALVICITIPARAGKPTPAELDKARDFAARRFATDRESSPPFSFKYSGKASRDSLKTWRTQLSKKQLDPARAEYTVTYLDPLTSLSVRLAGIEYKDFPVVEWTVYFRNAGTTDTLVIEDIQALDLSLSGGTSSEFCLNHNIGSATESGFDYEPVSTPLGPRSEIKLKATEGFSSQGALPYFNLQWADEGLIAVVGWPGQWAARFTRDQEKGLHLQAGQELTHFKLHPGEEVRGPRIVLLFWNGDKTRAQNLWRRWMFAHNMPRPGGKPLKPFLAASNSDMMGYTGMTVENQKLFIDRVIEERLPIDAWWVDAGWYTVPKGAPWHTYGTWVPDPERFPHGLKPVMEHARAKGLKTVLWFCPEAVRPGTRLAIEHPEWLLGDGLLNLANPDAVHGWVETADKYIKDLKLDVYRTDNDQMPLGRWRNADTPDRQGITEIRYVTGLMGYYDELRRRNPNLLIDNCCAGGRRNDVEMMRRSVPLWKSDCWNTPHKMQCQTYGLAPWIPYYGHATGQMDPYTFRSNMYPSGVISPDMRDRKQDFGMLRRMLEQSREISPNFLGDFYPLTPYSKAEDVWMAWQYDRPESGEGVVQIFRRALSPRETATYTLHGLETAGRYRVDNLDAPVSSSVFTGEKLMREGLIVSLKEKPGAAVVVYKRIQN